MKTIHRSVSGSRVKAIMFLKDWEPRLMKPIYHDFYVVATWHEYTDGRTTSYEAKTTVAICAKINAAKLIYHSLS